MSVYKCNASQVLLLTEVQLDVKLESWKEWLFQQRIRHINDNAYWYLTEITILASERKIWLIWHFNNFECDWACIGIDMWSFQRTAKEFLVCIMFTRINGHIFNISPWILCFDVTAAIFSALTCLWLNSSQRSRVGVGRNKFMGVKVKALLSSPRDWVLCCIYKKLGPWYYVWYMWQCVVWGIR